MFIFKNLSNGAPVPSHMVGLLLRTNQESQMETFGAPRIPSFPIASSALEMQRSGLGGMRNFGPADSGNNTGSPSLSRGAAPVASGSKRSRAKRPSLSTADLLAGDLSLTRCRRTDGKRWRCTRTVVANQKYCDAHMHRGQNREKRLGASGMGGEASALSELSDGGTARAGDIDSGEARTMSSVCEKLIATAAAEAAANAAAQVRLEMLQRGGGSSAAAGGGGGASSAAGGAEGAGPSGPGKGQDTGAKADVGKDKGEVVVRDKGKAVEAADVSSGVDPSGADVAGTAAGAAPTAAGDRPSSPAGSGGGASGAGPSQGGRAAASPSGAPSGSGRPKSPLGSGSGVNMTWGQEGKGGFGTGADLVQVRGAGGATALASDAPPLSEGRGPSSRGGDEARLPDHATATATQSDPEKTVEREGPSSPADPPPAQGGPSAPPTQGHGGSPGWEAGAADAGDRSKGARAGGDAAGIAAPRPSCGPNGQVLVAGEKAGTHAGPLQPPGLPGSSPGDPQAQGAGPPTLPLADPCRSYRDDTTAAHVRDKLPVDRDGDEAGPSSIAAELACQPALARIDPLASWPKPSSSLAARGGGGDAGGATASGSAGFGVGSHLLEGSGPHLREDSTQRSLASFRTGSSAGISGVLLDSGELEELWSRQDLLSTGGKTDGGAAHEASTGESLDRSNAATAAGGGIINGLDPLAPNSPPATSLPSDAPGPPLGVPAASGQLSPLGQRQGPGAGQGRSPGGDPRQNHLQGGAGGFIPRSTSPSPHIKILGANGGTRNGGNGSLHAGGGSLHAGGGGSQHLFLEDDADAGSLGRGSSSGHVPSLSSLGPGGHAGAGMGASGNGGGGGNNGRAADTIMANLEARLLAPYSSSGAAGSSNSRGGGWPSGRLPAAPNVSFGGGDGGGVMLDSRHADIHGNALKRMRVDPEGPLPGTQGPDDLPTTPLGSFRGLLMDAGSGGGGFMSGAGLGRGMLGTSRDSLYMGGNGGGRLTNSGLMDGSGGLMTTSLPPMSGDGGMGGQLDGGRSNSVGSAGPLLAPQPRMGGGGQPDKGNAHLRKVRGEKGADVSRAM
eukprot:jgi/Mesvir1/4357/Mv02440-RA.1